MLSPVVEFFRSRYRPLHCDCCNHNFEVASAASKENEGCGCKKLVQNWLASLKRIGSKKTAELRDVSKKPAEKRLGLRKFFYLKKARKCGIQRLPSDPVITQSEAIEDVSSDCSSTHIFHALISILTSLTSSDTIIQIHPNPPMICFLVHLARDLDTHGAFLSTLIALQPSATYLDAFTSLSYASSWLQSSLNLIRDSCITTGVSEPPDLQLPFVLLETEFQVAKARAARLQHQYPGEGIVIATLDLQALKEGRLVVSAGHAFRMLRVPVNGMDIEQKLLVWAGVGREEGAEKVLKEAVLAVMKWKEEPRGDKLEDVEKDQAFRRGAASGAGRCGLREQSEIKAIRASNCADPGGLRNRRSNLEIWPANDRNTMRRRGSCKF